MITWRDLWQRSEYLAERLPKSPGLLTIPSLPIGSGLLLLMAGLRQGRDICFDEKGCVPSSFPLPLEAISKLTEDLSIDLSLSAQESFPRDLPIDYSLSAPEPFPRELKDLILGRIFSFATSGSTGQARLIEKHSDGLLAEVNVLKALYGLRKGQQVLSLVRPFHIYGFLHSFLLPLFTETSLQFFVSKGSLPSSDDGLPVASDLLIMVPAHWHLLNYLKTFHDCRTLVSSGAAFGPERQAELLEERVCGRAYEILGSTETGGVGYRRLDVEDSEFRLFPGIRLETVEDGTLVHSPFLSPEAFTKSADRLRMIDDVHFRHEGRSDRIFKYAGQRHSLAEAEDLLRNLTKAKEVRCFFQDDTSKAQGGVLFAWIEGVWTEADLRALRPRYEEATRCPFPHRLQVLKEFPRDAQGKIVLAELLTHCVHPTNFG